MKIIDISEHNGKVDFNKVKKDGIEGVIIRAGYGKSTKDKRFEANIKAAVNAGMHIGVYWFSYAYSTTMAKNEAKACIGLISAYKNKLDLGVYFDWEYDSMNYAKKNNVTPTKTQITNMVKAFCKTVSEAGYKAGYYANPDYLKNHIDKSKLKDYLFWLAHYTDKRSGDCDIWQCSDKGKVSGITGSVDMDVLINAKLVASGIAESKTESKTESKPKKTVSTAQYHIVRRGDTLSALAVKYKTTVKKLAEINGIPDPNKIYVGEKLRVK